MKWIVFIFCFSFSGLLNAQSSEKKAYTKQMNRYREIAINRELPDGTYTLAKDYFVAWQDWLALADQRRIRNTNWLPLGVSAWQNGSYGFSPGNGRLNVVAVDPQDSLTLYVGSPTGGVWKTTNGGENWTASMQNFAWIGVSAIAVDPQNSAHLLVGTGDRDLFVTTGGGIYESFDYGETWTEAGLNDANCRVNKIIINPENSNVLLAASSDGVYRSVDAAQNWSLIYDEKEIKTLVYHPTDTSIVYGAASVFIRSSDGGFTFEDTVIGSDPVRLELAVTPNQPDLLYVLEANNASRFGSLQRSLDAGSTFEIMSDSPNILGASETGDSYDGQASYDLALVVSPENPDHIIAGGINAWRSEDAGQTWILSSEYHYEDGALDYTHADIHYFLNVESRIFCASDGGLFVTDNDGVSWSDLSAGLNISEIYRLDVCNTLGERVIIGTQDNGTNLSVDGNWTHVFGADGQASLLNPENPDMVFWSIQNGSMYRTDNNFADYQMISPASNGAWTTPLVMKSGSPNELYAGYTKVYRSLNYGDNWDAISPVLSGQFSNLRVLEVAPTNSNYIYAAVGLNLYVTQNAGLNWDTIVMDASVVDLAVSKTNPEHIYIVTTSWDSGVLFSEDAGSSFTDITDGTESLGLRCIETSDDLNGTVFVGTENSVLYRDTIDNLWLVLDEGLPAVYVRDLKFEPLSFKLYAGTYGRGVWSFDLGEFVSTENFERQTAYKLYPNPSNGVFIVEGFFNAESANIYCLDELGRKLDTKIDYLSSDALKISMQTNFSGSCYVRIEEQAKEAVVMKCVIQK